MKHLSVILFISIICISCKRPVQYPEGGNREETSDPKESLININKYLVKRQQDIIAAYAERMGWNMKVSQTGLYYMIYDKGKGVKSEKEKIITLDYKISLLDGKLCDASEPAEPMSFRIGHGGVEPGLEEGVLLLREGDKAVFIMSPHLAHGNFGDRQKIPAGEILIYDVHVISIR